MSPSRQAPLRLEIGRIGRQADAAVMARRGDTMVYTTLCVGNEPKGGDFVPMSIDYIERYSRVPACARKNTLPRIHGKHPPEPHGGSRL